MKTRQFFLLVTIAAFVTGCAITAPNELVSARSTYQRVSEDPAAKLVPAELHKAHEALDAAEQSFQMQPLSYKTKDLAYVAQRKAELAGALGAMAVDKASKDEANAEFQKKQTELLRQGKQDLSDAEQRAAEAQAAMAADKASRDKADADAQKQQDELLKQGKQDLSEAESRTAAALAELAKLAAVKEEARGLVLTLSGSVLFRSTESKLLPSARVKLSQVAKALLAVRARNLIIEGHTDARGTKSYNQRLSQRRADAVRKYLVARGYPAKSIRARGEGEGHPIAKNSSPEGRANNRRVEIVIERDQK
jgi:outer membrane protein OmpA-like peptidoglycan-associated protein